MAQYSDCIRSKWGHNGGSSDGNDGLNQGRRDQK